MLVRLRAGAFPSVRVFLHFIHPQAFAIFRGPKKATVLLNKSSTAFGGDADNEGEMGV